AFTRALVILPRSRKCWISLAKTYKALYPQSEIPTLLRAISIPDANTASVIAVRAGAMGVEGYYEEALADLNRAISLDRTVIEHCNKGLLFSYLKQYVKAIEWYEHGLRQNPNDYTDLYNITVAMIRWKGPAAAQKQIGAAYTALRTIQY